MLRFGLSLSALVFVADQASKWLVLGPGKFSPPGCFEEGYTCRFIELTPFFDLHMLWNRGVSFGLLRADSEIMRWGLVATSIIIAGIFVSWLRTAERRLTAIALGLIVGGALGNVIDRVRFGAVADFLDFNGLWFPWVFNVADAAITLGAIALVADMVLFSEDEMAGGGLFSRLGGRTKRPSAGPKP